MDDLIRRQDALGLVRDVCDAIMSCCGSHYDEETEDEVYDDILEVDAILKCNKEIRIALKNMPSARPEQRWIPCSERLPDEKKEVLISAENGLYIAELEIINGREYWSEVMEYRYIENVEAWMPLPESYLGETESRDYENKGDDDYGKQ